eukprot:749523-Hanusia_phi.AAC.1
MELGSRVRVGSTSDSNASSFYPDGVGCSDHHGMRSRKSVSGLDLTRHSVPGFRRTGGFRSSLFVSPGSRDDNGEKERGIREDAEETAAEHTRKPT